MTATKRNPVPLAGGNRVSDRVEAGRRDAVEHSGTSGLEQVWIEPATYAAAARLALSLPDVITPAEARFLANIAARPDWHAVPLAKAARLEDILDRVRRHAGGGAS
ncbi:MAG: hypothetical protein H7840_15435 [Alphaproteobacteria bacterium]